MVAEVSQAKLEDLLADDEAVSVIDIRSPAAFRRGHIPGSVNVPFETLADRARELDDAERVVTVCPHGEASVQAARLVAAYEGFEGTVASLSCGVEGWEGELATGDGDDESDADEAATDAPF